MPSSRSLPVFSARRMGLRTLLERSRSALQLRRPPPHAGAAGGNSTDSSDDDADVDEGRGPPPVERTATASGSVVHDPTVTAATMVDALSVRIKPAAPPPTSSTTTATATSATAAPGTATATTTPAAVAAAPVAAGPKSAATKRASAAAALQSRIHRLLGENPPVGSSARVVRRQYQSLIKERELEYREDDKDADAIVLYEVEFPKQITAGDDRAFKLGIDLETDFYGQHAVVKEVRRDSVAHALAKTWLKPGHIIVAVNGKDVSRMPFQAVLQEIREAAAPRVLRFLDPTLLPLTDHRHEPVLVNRDQYGFAKDDRYILNYRRQFRKRKLASYEHERQWAEFLQRRGGLDDIDRLLHETTDDPERLLQRSIVLSDLRTLVLRGIPVVLRQRVWSVLAHVSPYRSAHAASYYAELVAQSEQSPSFGDIEKDICRTYPEHPFFQSDQGKRELRNVLSAYSLHNPTIGYCQSMNFLAGMLILFMTEENAFWLLCAMLEKAYLPGENYTQSMVGTQTDQLVFRDLVAEELPALAQRFDLCGIQIQLITLHWFLCAFVCTLPTETALRVWDWFFLDGQEVLFVTAIGILKLAEPSILSARTHSDLHTIVRELGTDLHDEDALMRFLCEMAPDLATPRSSRADDGNENSTSAASNSGRSRDSQEEDEEAGDDQDVQNGSTQVDGNGNGNKTSDSDGSSTSFHVHTPEKITTKARRRKRAIRQIPAKLQQFLDLLESHRKDSPVFHKSFDLDKINQMRRQYRSQIECKQPPSVTLAI